jgi:hypothetical protein
MLNVNILSAVKLSVIKLSFIKLSAIQLSVISLCVVAPGKKCLEIECKTAQNQKLQHRQKKKKNILKRIFTFLLSRCHDYEQKDTQQNDTQHICMPRDIMLTAIVMSYS